MSVKCPKCGQTWPDDAVFCGNCGFQFKKQEASKTGYEFSFRMLFVILVISITIIALAFIVTGAFNSPEIPHETPQDHVRMTITKVDGYSYDDDYEGKTMYSLMSSAYFTEVPSDYTGYMIQTRYYDANDTMIAQSVDSLKNIYGDWEDADYPLAFGSVSSYKMLEPDYITVEITKNGELIDNYTFNVDKSQIEYLN